MAFCKKCHAKIKWIKSPRGKMIPCDAEEITAGGGELIILRNGETKRAETGDKGYISHWATCYFADKFRKK